MQGAFSNGKALGTSQRGEVWRHVTMVAKFLDLNNPSWQRRPFASSNDGRSCNNARESHTFHAIHVRFFLSNLQIFISSLSCKELYHGHLASWVRRHRASKRGNRLGESRKQKTKQNKLNCCNEQLYGVLDCRCSSWQLLGMKGTTQASGADNTSAGACWHNFYKQDSATWYGSPIGFLILWTLKIPVSNR